MKNKYVIIDGMAFGEEKDMEKLRNYAKEGWILEGISAGFLYKLKKDKPRDIQYSLDYQNEATEEYFNLFSDAGWTRVVSIDNLMHIFSAPAGAKAIYSDHESEMDKYSRMSKITSKGTIYSLIAMVVLIILLAVSVIWVRPVFIAILCLLIIDIIVFVFNFMPYLAYKGRIKELRETGKLGEKSVLNQCKLNAFCSICFLFAGIMNIIGKNYYSSAVFILLAVTYTMLAISSYKKKK